MTLHGIGILITAVAMVSMIPMVAAKMAQSTNVNILFPGLHGMNMNDVEGSVVSADATATTIQIDCRSSATSQCTSSGYLLPQTLTAGPSFQDFHYDVTSFWNKTIYIVTGTLDCNVTGSTLGASCYFSTSTWISSGTNSNSSVFATTASISSFNLKYNTLAVSSGLENLPTATAATNASPGHTGTSTSTPTTTTAMTPEHHSSSEAWIAGPVVGAVAGLALAAAAVFWFVSRRRKSNADPVYWNTTEGAPEISEHQAYLPAQNAQIGELPAKSVPAELSAPQKPHEMQ
ncbi:hypothetical protein N7481_006825 [Penicillium waksmanii]|uniref:uncharacterized protein n=1 Tax=Penicillium waksmanii TaxID=69791 RepID=UPI00254921C8|nr:uncharacterized protein N7481_006825 [Penicillium waksmanii]KAJ5984726.1 hypothetical protein N7481_006825 [Penicillium waksmanii]